MTSADLLLHPVRFRIIQAFVGDRRLTVADLSTELGDVSPASLYRHVALLTKAGVLEVAAERRVRAVVERTYMLRLHAAQIQMADAAATTPEQHLAAFMAYVAGMLGDVERYLMTGTPDLLRDGATYRIGAMWLTDDEFADLVRDLQSVFMPRLANAPAEGRRRRIVYNVLVPEPEAAREATRRAKRTTTDNTAASKKRSSADRSGPRKNGGAAMASSTPRTTAADVVVMARQGRFAAIRERLATPLQALLTADALRAAWEAELDRWGAVVSVGEPIEEPAGAGMVVVKIPVVCERGGLTVLVSVANGQVLAGIQLAPPEAATSTASWEPPTYADLSAFTESEVTIGTGGLAVRGTLSIPLAPGRHPAVVLLSGSGPLDRDETIGPNKPLKDLAWGLATRGIAVARFDKVTFAHPSEVKRDRSFTAADEYLPHALAALRLLRAHPAIDVTRVFVLGHSLGGTMAPLVAKDDGAVAGLVILAGGAQPLHWSAVRQVRYLASLDPATAPAAQPGIDALEAQARKVDSPDLSPETADTELPFGTPAPYWLFLRSYDPVATGTGLGKPMLIVQGGRDYQTTVADDLTRWQEGLDHRPDVKFQIYPANNHFFFTGTGPSNPAELATAQHVDPHVIVDITEWFDAPGR